MSLHVSRLEGVVARLAGLQIGVTRGTFTHLMAKGFSIHSVSGGPEAMDSRVSANELARVGVTVHIPPALRSLTSGQDEVLMEARDVASMLRELDVAFPGIRGRIMDETGRMRPYVNLFVNEDLVRGPLEQVALGAGDAVFILPSIAGGSLG